MGNCCKSISSTSVIWTGDDWPESVKQENSLSFHANNYPLERQRLLDDEGTVTINGDSSSSSSSSSTREIKIKISKRELEELMARNEIQGLSMEEILAFFINSSSSLSSADHIEMEFHHHHRNWKPNLQSIPEVN